MPRRNRLLNTMSKKGHEMTKGNALFEIMFGMELDGSRWAEGPESLGKMKCGPLGLLKFLETRYALSGIEASRFERVDAYAKKIKAAGCAWCRKSFEVDPWSTASTLLTWRDELMALKWDKQKSGDSVRFQTLAQIESSGPDLPLGVNDRLVHLLSEAKQKVSAELLLVDAFEDLPLIWREVIGKCFDGWKELPPPKGSSLNSSV